MFFSLNGFGDLIIFFVVVAFVMIVVGKDDNSKNDGNNWDQWRTHK